MFCKFLLLFFTFLFLSSCGRAPHPEPRRIAILHFYNQTSDSSLNWIGHAVAGIAAAEANVDRSTYIFEAANEREAWLLRATHTVEGSLSFEGGRLHLAAYLRNGWSNQQSLTATASVSEAPRVLADGLARQLVNQPDRYDTQDREAIRLFYRGAGGPDLKSVLAAAQASAAKDPKFGKAQVVRLEGLLATGQHDAAAAALPEVKAANLSATDRLRLAMLEANLKGDNKAVSESMEKLAGVTGDTALWGSAIEKRLIAKNFKAAAADVESALAIEPDNVQLWNILAYSRANGGDLNGAEKAIAEYRRIAPEDANALDSLGEIYFAAGRYADAERLFLEAFEKNKALLGGGDAYRAAWAALLRGDSAKADSHFAAFSALRKSAGDPIMPVRAAIWAYQSGRQSNAVSKLRALGQSPQPLGAAANTALSAFLATSGKLAEAQAALAKPSSDPLMAAAIRSPVAPTGLNNAAAWWLLLRGNYGKAGSAWAQVYEASNGTSASEARVALAWSLLESGQRDQAKALLERTPDPPIGPDPGLNSVILPKWRELRSRLQ